MQIKSLMTKPADSGIACSYRGDEDVPFQRVILLPKGVYQKVTSLRLLDQRWDPSTRSKFKERKISRSSSRKHWKSA